MVKKINYCILLFIMLTEFLNPIEGFVAILPQFVSSFGPNIIVHDSILFNSARNLIVSLNKDGVEYINRYSIQSGLLLL